MLSTKKESNRSTEAEIEEYRTGLTWRSISAIVFSTFILQGAVIYLYLISGSWFPYQAWIAILLWEELATAMGTRLSLQELYIITAFSGIVGTFGGITGGWQSMPMTFLLPLRNMYIGTTEYARAFGLTEAIPSWWAPTGALAQRMYFEKWVYFNSIWFAPLTVSLLSSVLTLIANISLGYFCYELYVSIEKLEFPAATAEANTIITLYERRPDRMRVLMLSAIGGILFNFVHSFIPFLGGPFIGTSLVWVPTIVDFTTLVAQHLPGASFAISSNLAAYIPGLLIRPGVATAMLMGSLAYYFFGTYIITQLNLWPLEAQPQTITSWNANILVDRSMLYFFTSTTIGLAIAAALIPFALHPRVLIGAFSKLRRVSEVGGRSRLTLFLGAFFLSSLASIMLNLFLAPDFLPYAWVLVLYTLFWSFFVSFVATSAAGVTFSSFNIPFQREFMLYYSGFHGASIYFAPVQTFLGAAPIAQALKQADMCRTRHIDYIKALIIIVSLSLVSSFLYANLFWSIQPFPSGAYPYTITGWPREALDFCRWRQWLMTGYLFKTDWIIGSFIVGTAIYLVSDLVFHTPWFLISFLSGAGIWGVPIAQSLAMFIGSLVGDKFIARYVGDDNWRRYRALVVIGFLLGDGFMNTLQSALWLVKKSMWLIPY